jgi:GT2 family glycosyltransferase/glycosyltransferase involved in cell wall biosynthesis
MSNVTTADLCFSASRPRSFNDRVNVPFYIFAPDFRDSSGGIRVLHYLCHILNEIGEEAYLVNTRIASPRLRTPLLTFSVLKQHFLAGQDPVTIYPEIVSDNPLNTPLIVRWLLNIPGHLGKPIEFEAKDLIYYYEAWCLPHDLKGRPLFIHPVDHTYFHNDANPDDGDRTLECYYANKYFLNQKPILEEHQGLISVGQEIKRSHEELATIFRKAKVLYCYEPSGIISEAQACGCPVLFVRSDYWPLPPHDTHHKIPGAAVYGDENALLRANESLKLIPETHARARDNSWVMTKNLAESVYGSQQELRAGGKPLLNDIQKLWALGKDERSAAIDQFCEAYLSASPGLYFKDLDCSTRSAANPDNEPAGYWTWRNRRQLQESDRALLEQTMQEAWVGSPSFHIIVRVTKSQFPLLAKTLESLNTQIYGNWRVDVISTEPSPGDAFNSLPQLAWHTVSATAEAKPSIDMIVSAHSLDCVTELPSGVQLDPLCLFRIAHEISTGTNESSVLAYFVDDDVIDKNGVRHTPRFKPGVDPEWIRCTDLLGPLFVRLYAWRQTGGAAAEGSCPWYDLALRIINTCGEHSIGHISEPLLTYPEKIFLENHTGACIRAVKRQFPPRNYNVKPVSAHKGIWKVEFPLTSTPMVSIAIPSRDKPEYLKQCVDLLLSKTIYPDYEVLIIDGCSTDPDMSALLGKLSQRTESRVRWTELDGDFNLARFANHAATHAQGEYLLLLSDDIRIIQADWLNQLMRHALRDEIICVAPVLASPPDGKIKSAGYCLGLGDLVGTPHQGSACIGEAGYLNNLLCDRSVEAVSADCMLLQRDAFNSAGGMNEDDFGFAYADIDLCLRLRQSGKRCLVTASVTLVQLGGTCLRPLATTPTEVAQKQLADLRTQEGLIDRRFDEFSSDRYWSKHLSRNTVEPVIELRCIPTWHVRSWCAPRIVAFPVSNAQGLIRLTQPLSALQRAGKAHSCVYQPRSDQPGIPSALDLARHNPDIIISHHFIGENSLMASYQWSKWLRRCFRVYAVDDLLTDMPKKSSLRQCIPADARSYLARILPYFDRLVVSTEFLAEQYGKLASETRVVPNRLERDVWMSLRSEKRTTKRPRVGWAGGTAHEGDLQIIAETVAATSNEIDWIFLGMCPDNIRPFIKEFHPFGDYAQYPQRLARLNLDLAVAPLEQIPFNRGKSNLRLLEYGALGIPVICTDIEPYRDSPACKVSNDPRAWLRALRERLDDLDAAAKEGEALQHWVTTHYVLEDHLESWLSSHLPD